MAIERNWETISLSPISVSGSIITVSTTIGLKAKQKISLSKPLVLTKTFEIKRVMTSTTILVGDPSKPIGTTADATEFDGGDLLVFEQERNTIGGTPIIRAVYDEEPTCALRVSPVDWMGNRYTDENPFPVYLSESAPVGELVNEFNSISSVAKDVQTDLLTYTVPIGKSMELMRVRVGGDNIATYELYKNGTLFAVHRTYFSGALTDTIEFGVLKKGIQLISADVLQIKVTHSRPWVGAFEANIQLIEI